MDSQQDLLNEYEDDIDLDEDYYDDYIEDQTDQDQDQYVEGGNPIKENTKKNKAVENKKPITDIENNDKKPDNDEQDIEIIHEGDEEEYDDEEPETLPKTTQIKNAKNIIVVKPENRVTSDIITKYEMTNIVSARAADIEKNNSCLVDISGLDCPIKQAKRELMMRKCPLMVRRYVGEKKGIEYYEDWNPNEMIFSTTYDDIL